MGRKFFPGIFIQNGIIQPVYDIIKPGALAASPTRHQPGVILHTYNSTFGTQKNKFLF